MQSDSTVLDILNKVLKVELTSINRYFLHARMYKNWGLEGLNEVSYKKSIKDMKQADDLIERILFLEGLPNLQALDPLKIGENTEEMLSCDLKFQLAQITMVKDAIVEMEKVKDFVSRDILVDILEYEEDYVDWLETQHYQITNLGLPNYLQTHIKEGE